MIKYQKTAVLGAGVIGASWAALFLASGRDVAVFDPSPMPTIWSALMSNGLGPR